ncbi:MAG TPA: type IV secretion system protein [Candidatus Dormibacteraeota bacterium]|nr:type IV secretion system protein [Candidatus Dormibacteraeota bacterium]
MGVFASFWTWLNGQLADYIGANTARVALALEPVVVTSATLYVMAWGFLHLTGRIAEPFTEGLKRLVTVAVVLAIAVHLWLYNTLLVDTFYRAPAQLAAAVVGTTEPVAVVDAIWERGGTVAGYLWNNGGVFSGDFGYYLAGASVWALVGLLCIYTMFLIALSGIALAVLLALGPFFLALLLFGATRRLFEAWLAQLANYALITVLTVLLAALLLQLVESYAAQTAARGAAIVTVDALNLVLVSVLVLLLMRQVMPIAAALTGGVALNSFGAVSRAVAWGMGRLGGAVQGAALLGAAQLPHLLRAPATRPTVQRAEWRSP